MRQKKSGTSDKSSGKGSDAYIGIWRDRVLKSPYFTEQQWYSELGIENKMGIISTGEASEVIKKISFKSYESTFKVMIIWLPERLHASAANRLLKLIEEPPGKTVFLLVTEDQEKIIGTIQSRTQILKIPPIKREDIAQALVTRYDLSPQRGRDISRIANGDFQTAIGLALDTDTTPNFSFLRDLLRLCYSRNVLGLLSWVDKIVKLNREQQKDFITYSLRIIRESFMLNLGLDDIVYIAGEEEEFSKNFSPFINGGNVVKVYNEFNLAMLHITRNGNAHIVFTDMTMKLVKLINKL